MTITTSTIQKDVLRPGIKTLWGVLDKQYQFQYPDFFKSEKSSMNYENYESVSGFGLPPVKVQGKDTQYFDPRAGYGKNIVNISYGMGFTITREMREYNMYRLVEKFTEALKESVQVGVDTTGASIFNNAFDSTAFTLGDEVELCGTHLLANGDTASNEAATPGDLSEATLRQALTDIRTTMAVDEAGKKIMLRGEKLVVHPNDEWVMDEILMSSKVPESNRNAENPLRNKLKGFVYDYLTDDDAFFVLTDHVDKLVKQNVVWPAEFKQDNAFDSDDMKMKTFYIIAFGAYNFRSIYGNPGV